VLPSICTIHPLRSRLVCLLAGECWDRHSYLKALMEHTNVHSYGTLLNNANLRELLAQVPPVGAAGGAGEVAISLLEGDKLRALVQGEYALTLIFEQYIEKDCIRCKPLLQADCCVSVHCC
jgi:hypothetical protein